ncbi:MAG: DUF6702 family protein [Pseudomonadota bacterium]
MKFKSLLVGLCLMALLPGVAAHKYFFGLTEVSLNPSTDTLEVVHQFTLHDIQRAMADQHGRNFRIDGENADARLRRWLVQNFQLTRSDGQPVKLNWVGFEADFQTIWFYQEAALTSADFCAWRVNNTLLMDVYSAQVNTVNFVTSDNTRGLTLTPKNHRQTVQCD